MAELERALGELAGSLGPSQATPEPLEGGITNRNYKVAFGGREYVLRLVGRETTQLGIDREAERRAGTEAAALGFGPAVVAAGDGWLLTAFLDCTPLAGDRLRADPAPVARALRAFHDSGLELPARFWVPELLASYGAVVTERGRTLPAWYASVVALAERIAGALPLRDPAPCHDDLLPSNLLELRAGGIAIVDWEYAGMGHRMFDLGNLAVNNEFDAGADEQLLATYFDGAVTPAHRAALKLMRIMSDAREAAWGVVQAAISELSFDFDAYAAEHYGRLSAAAADPRLEEWLAAAAA